MVRTRENCLLNTQKFLIFLDTICFVLHGFTGVLCAGFWLAYNRNIMVLFQVNGLNNTENVTLVKQLLDNIQYQPIYHAVVGAIEVYLGLSICCASCCELKTMLRVLSGVCVLFLLHNGFILILDMKKWQELEKAAGAMREVFLFNLHTMYDQTSGTDAVARFTFEMNGAQVMYGCCGVRDYRDYGNASLWKAGTGSNLTVPPTCCRLDADAYLFLNFLVFRQEDCMAQPTANNSHLEQGCAEPLLQGMETRLLTLAILWDSLSTFFYFLTIFLFVCQIRESRKQMMDPLASLRFGRFLDDMRQVVQHMTTSASRDSALSGKGVSKKRSSTRKKLSQNSDEASKSQQSVIEMILNSSKPSPTQDHVAPPTDMNSADSSDSIGS